jgi:hypothetical protein
MVLSAQIHADIQSLHSVTFLKYPITLVFTSKPMFLEPSPPNVLNWEILIAENLNMVEKNL